MIGEGRTATASARTPNLYHLIHIRISNILCHRRCCHYFFIFLLFMIQENEDAIKSDRQTHMYVFVAVSSWIFILTFAIARENMLVYAIRARSRICRWRIRNGSRVVFGAIWKTKKKKSNPRPQTTWPEMNCQRHQRDLQCLFFLHSLSISIFNRHFGLYLNCVFGWQLYSRNSMTTADIYVLSLWVCPSVWTRFLFFQLFFMSYFSAAQTWNKIDIHVYKAMADRGLGFEKWCPLQRDTTSVSVISEEFCPFIMFVSKKAFWLSASTCSLDHKCSSLEQRTISDIF